MCFSIDMCIADFVFFSLHRQLFRFVLERFCDAQFCFQNVEEVIWVESAFLNMERPWGVRGASVGRSGASGEHPVSVRRAFLE